LIFFFPCRKEGNEEAREKHNLNGEKMALTVDLARHWWLTPVLLQRLKSEELWFKASPGKKFS
jgi:hypothetical protein